MSYKTKIIKPDQLSAQEARMWAEWRAQNPSLYSPYFALGYTQLMASLVEDTHVLVIEDKTGPIGFLPFQAHLKKDGAVGFARPIGSPMTDYQGVICLSDTKLELDKILAQAGFGAFQFSGAVDGQDIFERFAQTKTPCTVMDLAHGADQWRQARDSSYRRHLKNNRKRTKKAEAIGSVRAEFCSADLAVFDQLMAWKQEKFAETGKYDVLGVDWTFDLIKSSWARGLGQEKPANLRADMHALYFGDTLAAVDLGLTDGTVFHSWMVAYNSEFHTLAPGIQLLERLIDAASDLGYTRVDLGEGIDGYKRHYATEDVQVLSGFIAASGPAATLSKLYGACEQFGERKLGRIGKLPGRARRRYAQISACERGFGSRAKAMISAVATGNKG